MRLATYNIRAGGIGRVASLATVLRAVAPDLVVIQEATEPAIVAALADAAGFPTWVSAPGQSVGVLSRAALAGYDWHRPRGVRRAFLEVRLADTGLSVFGVHLSAIHANRTEQRRVRELEALLDAVRAHADGPHLLAGDFNTLAPGETLDLGRLPWRLQLVAWAGGRRIQWQAIALLLEAGYVDAFRQLNPDVSGFTFPTWDPHVRLDYVFVPKGEAVSVRSCAVVDNAEGVATASDHFPLVAEIGDGAIT